MKITFKKIKPGAKLPTRNGAMYDLYIPEDVEIDNFLNIVELGFACKIPVGHHAEVYPRSSTFKRYGLILVNSIGVIDNEYCGDEDEWKLMFYALSCSRPFPMTIPAGTRLAQFTIVKDCEDIEFEEVETLGNANRGGFGSTGR